MRNEMVHIRLLIADDHDLLRDGVAMLLQAQPDMEIVGEASTGGEAMDGVEKLRPDVVLMDLSMPDMDGFAATQAIKARHPEVAVLALTMYDDEEHFLRALEAGADGFLPKRAAATDLIAAVRAVHRGEIFIYPPMAKMLLSRYLGHTPTDKKRRDHGGPTREAKGGGGESQKRGAHSDKEV